MLATLLRTGVLRDDGLVRAVPASRARVNADLTGIYLNRDWMFEILNEFCFNSG